MATKTAPPAETTAPAPKKAAKREKAPRAGEPGTVRMRAARSVDAREAGVRGQTGVVAAGEPFHATAEAARKLTKAGKAEPLT